MKIVRTAAIWRILKGSQGHEEVGTIRNLSVTEGHRGAYAGLQCSLGCQRMRIKFYTNVAAAVSLSTSHSWANFGPCWIGEKERFVLGLWTMDDEDTKANFDRLAKEALLELCSEHQGHGPRRGIRDIRKDIFSNDKYSKEEKQTFWEDVEFYVLFCSEFEYTSAKPEGQVDLGSYLHLACRHNNPELMKEIVDVANSWGPSRVSIVLNRKSRMFRRTPLHEALIMASYRGDV